MNLTTVVGLLVVTWLAGCDDEQSSADSQRALTVFAAASTTDLLGELAEIFEQQTGVRVVASFGASATLARQVENGAPCDVFLSADPQWAAYLERRGLLAAGTQQEVMRNELVLIAPRGKGFAVSFEPDFPLERAFSGRLALGDPTHAPAGQYARQALERLGWWQPLQARLIPTLDVRQALRLVARGEAGAGMVYATDAAASSAVEVVAVLPGHLHEPIRYVAAASKDASPQARAFLAFLESPSARAAIRRHGFRTGEPDGPPSTSSVPMPQK